MNIIGDKMPELHLRLLVEKDGEVISDSYQVGHSWIRNAYNYFMGFQMDTKSSSDWYWRGMDGAYYIDYSTTRHYATAAGYFNTTTADLTFGIILGSGTTAFHVDDYKLDTVIPSVNSAGGLYAQAMTGRAMTWTGPPTNTYNTLWSRVFNNNSGGTVTVNEVGLAYSSQTSLYNSITLLMTRDVLESSVNVLNGAQLTVTISITSPDMSTYYNTNIPTPWTAGMGGYYLGQIVRTDTGYGGFHRRYAVIIAPISDGELTAAKISTSSNVSSIVPRDDFYGGDQTTRIIALGADSPMGIAVAAANSAALGGYSDWYIPSLYELELAYTNRTYIPSGQEFAAASYWSSTYNSSTKMMYLNPTTGASGNANANTQYLTRLVRRIQLTDWVAD